MFYLQIAKCDFGRTEQRNIRAGRLNASTLCRQKWNKTWTLFFTQDLFMGGKQPRCPVEGARRGCWSWCDVCSALTFLELGRPKFNTCTVLGVKISHGHDYTSCATLGHFEMEFWCGTLDMILRHNVEYRASLSGLPILVPEWSKGGHLEREARQRGWKFGFFRGQMLMKWTEIFTEESWPPGPPFPPGFTPRVIRCYVLPCKTLLSGPKVARFCEGMNKVQKGARGWLLDK